MAKLILLRLDERYCDLLPFMGNVTLYFTAAFKASFRWRKHVWKRIIVIVKCVSYGYLSEEQESIKGEGLVRVDSELHDAYPLSQGIVLVTRKRPQLLILRGLEKTAGRVNFSTEDIRA